MRRRLSEPLLHRIRKSQRNAILESGRWTLTPLSHLRTLHGGSDFDDPFLCPYILASRSAELLAVPHVP